MELYCVVSNGFQAIILKVSFYFMDILAQNTDRKLELNLNYTVLKVTALKLQLEY